MESPPEMHNSDSSWPLTGSTLTSQSSLWPSHTDKSLPPTPRSRGVSLTRVPELLLQTNFIADRPPAERPASWNPRWEGEIDINLDRAILGTSLRKKREHEIEDHQQFTLESVFNHLKLADPAKPHYTQSENDFRRSKEVAHESRQRAIMNRIVLERGLNPTQFDINPKHARYFVIKSYNVFP